MKNVLLTICLLAVVAGCVQNGSEKPMSSTSMAASTTMSTTTIPAAATTTSTVRLTTSSPTSTTLPGPAGFEIHEWGVMVGCTGNDTFFLTSRPEQTVLVKQPVIYVHSKEKKPFTVKARFADGRPTETYPPAEVTGSTVQWRDVSFAGDEKAAPKGVSGAYSYASLENIMPILSDVDSEELLYEGVKTRFLYYEGEMRYVNNVLAAYDLESQEAYFTNKNDYPVYDVMIVLSKEGSSAFTPDIYTARADAIAPGERVSVKIGRQQTMELQDALTSQGFTRKEALAFSTLWKPSFFYQSNIPGWGHLIYRIPQEQYDKMIPIEVTPKPDKTVRTLYILVHL